MKRTKRVAALVAMSVLAGSLSLGTIASTVGQSEAATTDTAAPVAFSGRLGCGSGDGNGGYRLSVLEMSDPRLDGDVAHYFNSERLRLESAGDEANLRPEIASGTWRITTDVGAWQGSFNTIRLSPDEWVPTVYPLYGEGEYEGLVALHQHTYSGPDDPACEWSIRGVIIDGDLPAVPVPTVE